MSEAIVIAPDSFKGTIRAVAACDAIRRGWSSVRPDDEVRLMPMADGGEGTLDAFAAAVPGATRIPVTVTGPHDRSVPTSWVLLPPTPDARGGIAVVELASTSGFELLGSPPRLRPLHAHTVGFGEAIAAALDHGVSRVVLALGSSASTDGGSGMLTALGARFLDASGRPIARGGLGLATLAHVDISGLRPLPEGGVVALTDVPNPLLGPQGAAAVFGPQKGADATDITRLESGLARLAARSPVDAAAAGAGAAGGTGYGLLMWGAELVPGAAAVADLIGLRAALDDAALVITGEGAYDAQSARGKVPAEVAARAAAAGVPTVLVAGVISPEAATGHFAGALSLTEIAGSSAAARTDPARWLAVAGAAVASVNRSTAEAARR